MSATNDFIYIMVKNVVGLHLKRQIICSQKRLGREETQVFNKPEVLFAVPHGSLRDLNVLLCDTKIQQTKF